ncbi:MAG: hypothetical protein Tsb0014_45580 [Pleurocapsa sp.]
MKKKTETRGKHPNSLKNLQLGGNKIKYDQPKKQRSVSLTDEGWSKCRAEIKSALGITVSEFLEQIGRGEIKINGKVIG